MADKEAGQATEGESDSKNKDLAEQYKALQDKLEKVIAAQSGSDKKVQELLGQLDVKEKEKQSVSQEKLTLAEQVKALKDDIEKERSQRNLERQRVLALELISGTDIPKDLITPYIGASDDETKQKVTGFLTWFKAKEETIRKEVANKMLGGTQPPKSGDSSTGGTTLTQEMVNKMPVDELKKFMKEKPAQWQAFVKSQPQEQVISS